MSEAARIRRQAGELLTRLLEDRESSEQRLAASGKRDPIKSVTGVTALERAIRSTREMITEMDLMLADLDGGIQSESTQMAETPVASVLRPAASGLRLRTGGMLNGQRTLAATV